MNNKNQTLGSLCSQLAYANIMVYHYENNKWWKRKNNSASLEDINNWDLKSRTWCEKRAKIKNLIDDCIIQLIQSNKNIKIKHKVQNNSTITQIVPISLIIDMLTIEQIKKYDLKRKSYPKETEKVNQKIKNLCKLIDETIRDISLSGKYTNISESRTF